MPRRRHEPEEAFGPSIDGREQIERLELALRHPPEDEPEPEPEILPEPEIPQVALICGSGEIALACGRLASRCGFAIELAVSSPPVAGDELASLADAVHVLENYDDIVQSCGIDSNHYVCVFVGEAPECEHILYQCLPSDAAYLGAWAEGESRREIFAMLKEDGAPDAELAAICCPMGLGIGAKTPEQDAVAVVAEMLAARSGVLKRLRYRNQSVYN